MPELEVIAMTVEDALNAVAGGATSIEIIKHLDVGGLTPELDLVRQIVAAVDVETHVIVRPHAESFVYSAADKKQMLASIETLAAMPITSVVIGGMTTAGNFDFDFLHEITSVIDADRITIHRAIDHVNQPRQDLQSLSETVSRVLCSGAPTTAYDGRETMGAWLAAFGDAIHFKCGGGITMENIKTVHQAVNAPMYHTGRAVRTDDIVNTAKVKQVINLLNSDGKL